MPDDLQSESDLEPLREIRRRDAAPEEPGDDGGGAGTGSAAGRRRSTFRRHPARWLAALAALVSLGAVAVGLVWTWWHSTIEFSPGLPAPSASPGPGSPAPTGSPGSVTVSPGCDSGCSPVDDTCNKAFDDTATSCFNNTCNDPSCTESTCGEPSCNDLSCNDPSCNDSSCGGTGSGAAHLAQLALGHLVAGPPLLFEARRRASVPARVVVRLIRWYQRRVSGRLGITCRYSPSCSRYGLAAIERYGLLDGARLAADRIHRCTPAVPVGTPDPLPGR